jgi:putative hemolysin
MTPVELALLLSGIVALIFLSALFSGLETALFSLQPHQLRRLEQNHPALGNFVQLFRDKPRRVLNGLLLGDGLVKVPLVVFCLILLWRGPFNGRLPQWLTAIVIFAFVVVLCDLIPKLIALAAPYRLSTVGAFALQHSVRLLDRVGRALETVSTTIVDLVTPHDLRSRPLSDDEFETLVEIGEEEGTLHEAEGEMIQEIIKMGDKTAKDCMTPRVDAFALADDLRNEDVIAQLKEKRFRRVPVYADTPDNVVGIIDVKLFLLDSSEHYTETLLAPSFVPETMHALDLLKLFLTHPQSLAVVVDEFGGTEGIITMSDIIEEILGDAAPARGDVDLYIEPLENGRFLVSGDARLDDLREHLGFELVADGIDTIGGLVSNRLGYLPQAGATIELPRLTATVRRTSRKRIQELLLEKTTCIDNEADESTEAA